MANEPLLRADIEVGLDGVLVDLWPPHFNLFLWLELLFVAPFRGLLIGSFTTLMLWAPILLITGLPPEIGEVFFVLLFAVIAGETLIRKLSWTRLKLSATRLELTLHSWGWERILGGRLLRLINRHPGPLAIPWHRIQDVEVVGEEHWTAWLVITTDEGTFRIPAHRYNSEQVELERVAQHIRSCLGAAKEPGREAVPEALLRGITSLSR